MSSLFLLVAGYVRQVIKTKKSNDDLSKLFCDFYDNPCNYPILRCPTTTNGVVPGEPSHNGRLIRFGKSDYESKYVVVLKKKKN